MRAKRAGLSDSLLDRLMLNEDRLADIAHSVRLVAELPDPVGETFDETDLPNGLHVRKQRVPLGVIGVIYEARPNVTVDVASLALKSGNAVILRGGSETLHSNRALVNVLQKALTGTGVPADAVQFIDSPDRALVLELLHLKDHVDMIIPRGGAGLHDFCRENSHIPVITGGIGICHLFVDDTADLEAALRIIHNAKTQRPSVCNALDTVLVHRAVASEFLPRLINHLAPAGVTFRADPVAASMLQPFDPSVSPAGADDFDTEWLSLVLGLKVVDGLDEAIDHIAAHSTAHSDGILTRTDANAATLHRRGGFRRCVRQCQHALHRWHGTGAGRGGRRLHPAPACPRSDGTARTDHLQVGRHRAEPCAGVIRCTVEIKSDTIDFE